MKIKNLIRDLHCKFSKWLCENYHIILLPKFETSQMVKRGKRRIRSKTAFAMLTWSHYNFKQRLLNKTREYPWCKVLIVDEHYTSKTCGLCGNIHKKLGGSKVFKCPSCGIEADRDAQAARNILLRYLTLLKEPGVIPGVET
jgi:putative transposase